MLFEILNTIWLFLIAVFVLGCALGVWFAIALWQSVRQQTQVAETLIYSGSDREED